MKKGVACLLWAALALSLLACSSDGSPQETILGMWKAEGGTAANDTLEFYGNDLFAWTMTEDGVTFTLGGEYALNDEDTLRLFPWGEGEATAKVSMPSKDTLILELAFPSGDAETLVLRKMDTVGKPVNKSLQTAIVSSTWRDTYTPDGHVTHDFFEDGTLIIRLHQTATPYDENYVWDYVTAGTYELVGDDRMNISIFGEAVASQVFLPTRDTFVIKTEDDLPYTVLRRLEGERPHRSDDPSKDIVGTWRSEYGPEDFLQMEFYADGTINRTQEYGLVEVGEVDFVEEDVILVKLPEMEYAAEIAVFPGAYLVHRLPYEGELPVVFLWVE